MVTFLFIKILNNWEDTQKKCRNWGPQHICFFSQIFLHINLQQKVLQGLLNNFYITEPNFDFFQCTFMYIHKVSSSNSQDHCSLLCLECLLFHFPSPSCFLSKRPTSPSCIISFPQSTDWVQPLGSFVFLFTLFINLFIFTLFFII